MAYVPLSALWLPIILAAVIVFVASSIMHTVLQYHRRDYRRLPDEENVMSALRSAEVRHGFYTFPFSTHKEMKSPEMAEKFKRGPAGFVTIFPPGAPQIPKFLAEWFVFCIVVGIFVAYITGRTLAVGTDYLQVFRVAGSVAFLAYGLGHLSDGIWKGQPWGMTLTEVADGFIYGLLTAGTFGWLWPR